MKNIWDENDVKLLTEWWPHWGTAIIKPKFNQKFTAQQIKSKVDKLFLKMLPRNERKCITCSAGIQHSRKYGKNCRKCGLNIRKYKKLKIVKTRDIWIKDLLRTLRYRSIEPCNLSIEYLLSLWNIQNGKCVYTSHDMREPIKYGEGRSYYAASLDRINSSKGYVKGNVIWCCWGANVAKQEFQLYEFIENCKTIYDNKLSIMKMTEQIAKLIE